MISRKELNAIDTLSRKDYEALVHSVFKNAVTGLAEFAPEGKLSRADKKLIKRSVDYTINRFLRMSVADGLATMKGQKEFVRTRYHEQLNARMEDLFEPSFA